MKIIRPNYQEIVDKIYQDVISQTSFRGDLDDSALGVLIKSVAAQINSAWDYAEQVAIQSDVYTAFGEGLDQLGSKLGVLRVPAIQANSLGYSKPVRFTNLGSTNITIPIGTRVWGTDAQLAFFTLEGISLQPGISGEVHVRAAEVGDIYNVPIGYINQHSFPGQASVTNVLPIQEGSFRESDESYRSRLISAYRRRVVFNQDTCTEMLRGVPNVKDVIFVNQPYGPGTFDVIIDPYIVSQISTTVAACQSLLDEYVPIGIAARALGAFPRNVDILISLTFKPNSSSQQSIRDEIKAQISATISSIPIESGEGEGVLYLDQLRGIAQNADNNITYAELSVGLDGVPLSPTGSIKVNRGEKITLRSLVVR